MDKSDFLFFEIMSVGKC